MVWGQDILRIGWQNNKIRIFPVGNWVLIRDIRRSYLSSRNITLKIVQSTHYYFNGFIYF